MISTDITAASAVYLGSVAAQKMYIGSTLIWQQSGGQQEHDYSQDYFTIESLEDNNNITATKNGSSKSPVIYYSIDGGETWNNQTLSSGTISFGTINTGESILFKCEIDSWASAWNAYNKFNGSKNFKVYGNSMSLLYGDNFTNNSEFGSNSTYNLCGLFYEAAYIVDASNLIMPALTCKTSCYNGMFRGCTNLLHAPLLPALYSAQDCYSSMFEGCINLEKAPEINLINLSITCCKRMFCMSRSAKLTTPKMTKGPILKVQSGNTNCYEEMFKGNGNLVEVTCLLTNHSVGTKNWLLNCSNTGTFYKGPNTTWGSGTGAIPSGWTIQEYTES